MANNSPVNPHVKIQIPGANVFQWWSRVVDPDGIGRDSGYVPLVSATIDPTGLADAITDGMPADNIMYDVVAGVHTPFIRRFLYDDTGVFIGTEDRNPDGTPYVVAGTVVVTQPPERTFFHAFEVLTFGPAAITLSPGVYGTLADLAEIHVWDGDILWRQNGVAPDEALKLGFRNNAGTSMKLNSLNEIQGFIAKGLSGAVGTIYVEYFEKKREDQP